MWNLQFNHELDKVVNMNGQIFTLSTFANNTNGVLTGSMISYSTQPTFSLPIVAIQNAGNSYRIYLTT